MYVHNTSNCVFISDFIISQMNLICIELFFPIFFRPYLTFVFFLPVLFRKNHNKANYIAEWENSLNWFDAKLIRKQIVLWILLRQLQPNNERKHVEFVRFTRICLCFAYNNGSLHKAHTRGSLNMKYKLVVALAENNGILLLLKPPFTASHPQSLSIWNKMLPHHISFNRVDGKFILSSILSFCKKIILRYWFNVATGKSSTFRAKVYA